MLFVDERLLSLLFYVKIEKLNIAIELFIFKHCLGK